MAKFSVIYDSCVLYPAPLRDLLMQLAVTDLFKIDLAPAIACGAIKRQRESLKNPP